MKQEKTLTAAIEEQRRENELKIQVVELQYKLKELTGFLPSISSFKKVGDCVISFHSKENEYVYPDGITTFDQMRHIANILPPIENYKLTFAGKDPQPTDSPFTVHFANYSHQQKCSIKYRSEYGQIWIDLKPSAYPKELLHTYEIQGAHKGFGKYETWRGYRLQTPVLKYSGDHNTNYCDKTKIDPLQFESIVFVQGVCKP